MLVIVDYGMCNVGSIRNMLKRVGVKAVISSDPSQIETATGLILPGVGTFDHGMAQLKKLDLIPPLENQVMVKKVPILGICLGMQLLSKCSEEGSSAGLGWLAAETRRFDLPDESRQLKVPHMGWNTICSQKEHFVLSGLADARFYFVHSYHVCCPNQENVLATCRYGIEFTAAVHQVNILGTQFHPEKSHRFGVQLFENLVRHNRHVQSEGNALPAAARRRAG